MLLASLLRKIGIDAVLLFEPDHCYVGFFLDRQREKLVCLDSTLLDAELEEPEEIEPFLDLAITEENRDEYSWPSFVESVKQANERLKVTQSRFDDPSQNEFFSIDLAEARNLGILAIPFTSKDEFVPYVSDEESEEESE